MTDLRAVAERIFNAWLGITNKDYVYSPFQNEVITKAELIVREVVEEALAVRDAEQFGEAFMLNGKRIAPNEVYKSTSDYVKEARAEMKEECAKTFDISIEFLQTLFNGSHSVMTKRDLDMHKDWQAKIRALKP